jgi:prostaglandin-E synthase
VYFRASGGTDKKEYEVTMTLFDKINAEQSRFVVRQRNIELVLIKDKEAYWPRLLSEKTKLHWLKVDFNKWKDEEESDEEATQQNDFNFEDLMSKMGTGGGGDNFNVGDEEAGDDSDEEQIPDLE